MKLNFTKHPDAIRNFISTPSYDDEILLNKDAKYPKLSIITPSFNQAVYLEKTILSVLNQNYPNLEYIIIDGGSTDGSVDVIKKYEKYLAYWVSEKDNGQTDAINKGLLAASGDWMGWQNSDDVYLPGAFDEFIHAAKADKGLDLIYADLLFIDSDDSQTGKVLLCPVSLATFISDGVFPHNQSAFWSKRAIERLGPLDNSLTFSMDYEFFLRFFFHKLRTKHFPGQWGGFRLHKESKTSNIATVCAEENLEIIHRYGLDKYHNNIYKMMSVARRASYYITSGEWGYLLYLIGGHK